MSILRIPRSAQSPTTDSETSQSTLDLASVPQFRTGLALATAIESEFFIPVSGLSILTAVEVDSRAREERSLTQPLEPIMVRCKPCDG